MTTLSHNNKLISFKTGELIGIGERKQKVYTIQMPEIVCTDPDDAKKIQEKINEFTGVICREMLGIDS